MIKATNFEKRKFNLHVKNIIFESTLDEIIHIQSD